MYQSSIEQLISYAINNANVFLAKEIGSNCTQSIANYVTNLSQLTKSAIKGDLSDSKTSILQISPELYQCLTLSLSKLVGYGIVVGSSLVKLPQIIAILLGGSAEGLAFSGYFLESIGYLINIFFNYRMGNAFGMYGECVFVLIQNLIVMSLIFLFSGKSSGGYLFSIASIILLFGIFAVAGFALNSPKLTPTDMLIFYQATASTVVSVVAKLPQIIQNYLKQSTGTLSSITCILYFLGSLGRVFTSWRETSSLETRESLVLIGGFLLATFLNGLLVLQLILYRGSRGKKEVPKEKKNE